MDEEIKFNSLIPELSVSNIENSKKFYQELGFKIIYERPEDKFCFIQLEENQIMIEEINGNWNVGELKYPYGNGINISMSIKDVEKLYNSLKNKNLTFSLQTVQSVKSHSSFPLFGKSRHVECKQ